MLESYKRQHKNDVDLSEGQVVEVIEKRDNGAGHLSAAALLVTGLSLLFVPSRLGMCKLIDNMDLRNSYRILEWGHVM